MRLWTDGSGSIFSEEIHEDTIPASDPRYLGEDSDLAPPGKPRWLRVRKDYEGFGDWLDSISEEPR